MAKKKRQISKKKRKELLRKKSGQSFSQINKLDRRTLYKDSDYIIEDRPVKRKKSREIEKKEPPKAPKLTPYQQFKARVSNKRMELASQGFLGAMERGVYSDRQIDKVKLEDLKQPGRINRSNYPWLFPGAGFDYDKIYPLKGNNALYVAYRDYTQEYSIEEHLATFSKHSNAQLLDELEAIVNQPPTYSKSSKRKTGGKTGTSSGKAGDMLFMVANKDVLKVIQAEAYNANRRAKRKKRQHSGPNVGYQVIKNGRLNTHTEVTPRNLLIMANAIMYNVTEFERVAFYRNFYKSITDNIPEMREILPRPKY